MKRRLPHDVDGMNGRRAERAAKAVAAFRAEVSCDTHEFLVRAEYEDSLGNLLADLMHWADRNDFNFKAALDRAQWHYLLEADKLFESWW
jgi:hypothetical protein